MLVDQFNRFFYRLKVTSFDGQHTAELPPSILRLISDVTISESSYSDTAQTAPTLTLNLNETSYLPEVADLKPAADVVGSGIITNRPGSILDLRFDGERGFTYVSKSEMESGITRNKRTQTSKPQPVIFLFKGGNTIEIEWGLISPRKSRKRTFVITTVSMQGGGSGHGTVVLTALDGTLQAQKTKLDVGIVYREPNGKPSTLKQVLWKVCKSLNCGLEFDNELVTSYPANTTVFIGNRTVKGGDTAPPDPSSPITQMKQMSMHDFVKDLANDFSSSYEFYNDPITQKQILKFTYREVRYANVDRVFTYKSINDVVLSYKVDSIEGAFNPISGASSTSDGSAKSTYVYVQPVLVNDTKVNNTTTKTQDKVSPPANPEDQKRVKDNLGRNYVEINETSPTKSDEALSNHASSLYSKNKYNSTLTLSTLGDPDYTPSLIQMNNIGLRFSKKYRMFTVQHKLNASGYLCSWSGMSHYDGEGGVNSDDASKENKAVSTVTVLDKNK